MLKIDNLSVKAGKNTILKNLDLCINDNEIHVIMGLNGTGKSTLCKVILGNREDYKITSGTIEYNGEDITDISTSEIAKKGIYFLEQNPTEIPGVSNAEMLRLALDERGMHKSIFEFNKEITAICEKLNIDKSFIHRGVNERMSGGEKKKNEILGLYMLKPSLILLDEMDSGLDIDSLKTLSESLNTYKKESKCSIVIITHHMNILNYITPDKVHILSSGKIITSGDVNLAKKIENDGFSGAINMATGENNE